MCPRYLTIQILVAIICALLVKLTNSSSSSSGNANDTSSHHAAGFYVAAGLALSSSGNAATASSTQVQTSSSSAIAIPSRTSSVSLEAVFLVSPTGTYYDITTRTFTTSWANASNLDQCWTEWKQWWAMRAITTNMTINPQPSYTGTTTQTCEYT
ncbi:hypothetical protein LTR56_020031 [Elasticomyces elasticus]|nr:hypothetical protein LTR56_020031 [Elasticomyces elasticus]KAK3634166.1 hypothetical protein LTR22_019775 [Elasticomyces elasticus]KAK4911211.1 hypothetical protein LTR49_020177 [Elasticomyces elasticus]KAK5750690.1 hypothetical protein LTS12_019221 [Elasticomyces elasticus]